MLQIDPTHMIAGRRYFIKTILAGYIPYTATLRFNQYYTRKEWDYFTQQSITIQFADFICQSFMQVMQKSAAYNWDVRVEDIKECYAIAGSSKEQRDIQLGLLGSLPSGKSIPYELGRYIASYV